MNFHQKLNILIEEELKSGKSVGEISVEFCKEFNIGGFGEDPTIRYNMQQRIRGVKECMEDNDEYFLEKTGDARIAERRSIEDEHGYSNEDLENDSLPRNGFYQCDMMPKEDKGEGFTPIK